MADEIKNETKVEAVKTPVEAVAEKVEAVVAAPVEKAMFTPAASVRRR